MKANQSIGRALRSIRSPRRAARSRGFGVHSPFAFRFVREVLTQRYAYYCYKELDRASAQTGVSRCAVRAIFRLALWYRPATVCFLGDENSAAKLALSLGNPECEESIATTTPSSSQCICAMDRSREQILSSWQEEMRGMIFVAPELTVWIKSDYLPHQRFDIILP